MAPVVRNPPANARAARDVGLKPSVISGQKEITCKQSYTCESLKSYRWSVHTTCTATYHCVNTSPCLFLPSNIPRDRLWVSGISGKNLPCPLNYSGFFFSLRLYMTADALTNVQKIQLHCRKSKAVESDGPHMKSSSATPSVVHRTAEATSLGSLLRCRLSSPKPVSNHNRCVYKIPKWLVCPLQLQNPPA